MYQRPSVRAEAALDLLHKGNSPSTVTSLLASGVGGGPCSRRTAQRAVATAFEMLKADYEESGCDRQAMAAQCINLLLEGAQQSLKTNQPGSLAACIAQLDKLVGLSAQSKS